MQSFKLNPENIMTEVYSYPFPEVRELLDTQRLDPRFMLNTLGVETAAGYLASYDFQPELTLPAREDGSLDLDELHVPVIERIRKKVGASLKGIDTFDYAYPTHGSSPAIFTLLAEWHAKGEIASIGVLEGEYEGYTANAENLNIQVNQYPTLEGVKPKEKEMWFISNPSAIDGNWIDEEVWKTFLDAGNQVVYDAAYVGLTQNKQIDVSSPNIRAVITSPSKIFGVFRYRDTGVAYVREPVASMYGTRWFKDVPALLDTLKLYETFKAGELYRRYYPVQQLLCTLLAEMVECEVIPSDVLLLANSKGPVKETFNQYRRADGFRFGLTKLFEDFEFVPTSDSSPHI